MRLKRGAASGGGLAMMAAFAGTSLANYAFSLAMGRLLLPGDFGALAFVQTLLLLAGLVLESGVPWSLARELVGADPHTRAAMLRGAALSNLALAAVMSAALIALFALGPLRAGLESWPVTLLAAASLPLIALVGVARGAAQGTERFGALALVSASEVVGKAVGGLLLVLLGLGVAGAVGGFVVGALLSVLLGVVTLRKGLPGQVLGKIAPMTARMAGPMFGALLGGALLLNIDLLLLKVLPGGGRVASGQYQAAVVLANAPYFLASSVLVPLAFARMTRRTSLPDTASDLRRVTRLAALYVLPLEFLLVLLPGEVLGLLFPGAYAAASLPLQIRAGGTALLILVTLLSAGYQATGHARRAAALLLGMSGLEALVLTLAVPALGVSGAALSFALVMLLALIGLGGHYLTQLGSESRRRAARWGLRYGLSLLVGGAVLFAAPRLGVPSLLAALLALAAFAALARLQRLHLEQPAVAAPVADSALTSARPTAVRPGESRPSEVA